MTMTIEDIIKGLLVHLDYSANCDDCPLKDMPNCFEKLTLEAIRVLEKEANNDKLA